MPKVQGHDSIDLTPKRTGIGIKLEKFCKYQHNAVMFQFFPLLKRNQKVEKISRKPENKEVYPNNTQYMNVYTVSS
jgi:hypothetical protein